MNAIRGRLAALRRAGKVGPRIHHLLQRWLDRVEKYALAYPKFSPEDRDVYGPEIILSFLEVERTLETMEGRRRVDDSRFKSILRESIARMFGNAYETEVVVAKSPRSGSSLLSSYELDSSGLAFVLFLSPTIDYNADDLLMRAVHEAAHAHPGVSALVEEKWAARRRLGEALCDLLGTLIGGPAFIHSGVRVMEIIGSSAAQMRSETHPSLICRTRIEEAVVDNVWTQTAVLRAAKQFLQRIGILDCDEGEREDLAHLKDEVLAQIPRFAQVATDEDLLEHIYAQTDSDQQSSILLALNAKLVAQGLGV